MSNNSVTPWFLYTGTPFAFLLEGYPLGNFWAKIHRFLFSLPLALQFLLPFLAFLGLFSLFLGHFRPKTSIRRSFRFHHYVVCPPFPVQVNVARDRGTTPPKIPNIDPMGERGAWATELLAQNCSIFNRVLSYEMHKNWWRYVGCWTRKFFRRLRRGYAPFSCFIGLVLLLNDSFCDQTQKRGQKKVPGNKNRAKKRLVLENVTH